MTGITSELLRVNRDKIIALWVDRSLREVPSAVSEETLALRNSLPLYLEHLSDALAINRKMDVKSVLAHNKESIRINRLHGADRAGHTSYGLTEVIFEYHIMREVIFQFLETKGQLDQSKRDIIYDSIEQAVNDAAVKFSEVHAAIQQKFIDTLTHDLKTPLTSARMSAEIILRRSERADVCIKSASRIVNSLDRLESMIHDLLDASRVRAGEALSLQFTVCDLDPVVRAVADEMTLIHVNPIIVESTASVIGTWACDGVRRVLENLIGNAVKYGARDMPITISLSADASGAHLCVHNQGSALSAQKLHSLFQHHARSVSAQEGTMTGWGLGLTLVRGVVDAHGGTIRVESAEGRGTRFILDLPQALAAA